MPITDWDDENARIEILLIEIIFKYLTILLHKQFATFIIDAIILICLLEYEIVYAHKVVLSEKDIVTIYGSGKEG